MRSPLLRRAAVVLAVVAALQGGASAFADAGSPDAAPPAPASGSVDPFTPFMQGASVLAGMAEPFYNAAAGFMSPQG
ncbi:hypothetical protein [Streptomyces sp. Ru71]|uniref:hypothetical protein n=1 Tax=Streptomyces sp. Ru71 TaxID=2080746 RepID=UPI0015E27EAE|nr:hypothetical protein [Streptomyces sp. Ru71]